MMYEYIFVYIVLPLIIITKIIPLPLDTAFNLNNKLNQNCIFGYKRQNDNVGNLISKMTT
jgi:hypothetical protein